MNMFVLKIFFSSDSSNSNLNFIFNNIKYSVIRLILNYKNIIQIVIKLTLNTNYFVKHQFLSNYNFTNFKKQAILKCYITIFQSLLFKG